MANPAMAREANYVLTLEEIGNLTQEGGKPAETLMNVVALIARRFQTDVCSAYLLEPDRANLVLAATLGLRQECVGTLRMAIQEGNPSRWSRWNGTRASSIFAKPEKTPTNPSWESRSSIREFSKAFWWSRRSTRVCSATTRFVCWWTRPRKSHP